MSNNKKWVEVGAIFRSLNEQGEDTGKKYIRLENTPELMERLSKGAVNLTYAAPITKFQKFLEGGYITEEEFEKKVANISPKVAFQIQMPPEKD